MRGNKVRHSHKTVTCLFNLVSAPYTRLYRQSLLLSLPHQGLDDYSRFISRAATKTSIYNKKYSNETPTEVALAFSSDSAPPKSVRPLNDPFIDY